jgi:CHAT domain-containing protein/tetratricopeptide (TPR) repeat protein
MSNRHGLFQWLALVLLLAMLLQAPAAAPPVPSGRLTAERTKKLDSLAQKRVFALVAGRFKEALETAEVEVAVRQRWQGPRHWQTVNARYLFQRLQPLAGLSLARQEQMAKVMKLVARARILVTSRKFREAEKIYRQAFTILSATLGEEHPEIAFANGNLAFCLMCQVKLAQALDIYQSTLTLNKKVLGKEHPDTARSYSLVAAALGALGKSAKALPYYEKSLAIRKKVLGEEHPDTAMGYNDVAVCLNKINKPAQALPLYEKALSVKIKIFGADHQETAVHYANLGACFFRLGHSEKALPLLEKSLAIQRKFLGEEHIEITHSLNGLAACLEALGKPAQAMPLFHKCLAIRQKVSGDEHPDTADSYDNLAGCMKSMGRFSQALPLYEKALAIRRKVLGEQHPATGTSYNNTAICLQSLGRWAQALPLYEKALAIRQKALGEEHPATGNSHNNLALCLQTLGKSAQALAHYKKALTSLRKSLGEGHRNTLALCNNIAVFLHSQGQTAQAVPLLKKALASATKANGEEDPLTARTLHNLAASLDALGKSAQALPFHQKALAVRKKILGEEHPDTALSSAHTGLCLLRLGKTNQAVDALSASLPGYGNSRLTGSDRGFDRAQKALTSPYLTLAMIKAGQGKAVAAWQDAESGLARSLLEDLYGAQTIAQKALANRLSEIDIQVLALYEKPQRSEHEQKRLEALTRDQAALTKDLVRQVKKQSDRLVWPLEKIQQQIPNDAAMVLWLAVGDVGAGAAACVVRSTGQPRWVQVKGTGPQGAWTKPDASILFQLRQRIIGGRPFEELARTVRRNFFEPILPHLQESRGLPAVRKLYVIHNNLVPIEVLAPDYEVTYSPSATLLAQARSRHRALQVRPALALGDPPFESAPEARPPADGLLLVQVAPGGNAHKAGLRAGDLLLRFADQRLQDWDDLAKAVREHPRGQATYWRNGKKGRVQLAMPLGARLDRRSGPVALADWRRGQAGTRGEKFDPLPGTRAEVAALQRLLGKECETLLGSDASEQRLEAMAGELKKYRLIHLATHGQVDIDSPERSRLILARDRLPGLNKNEERVRQGKRPITGELTVDRIVNDWKLDADLVVLSACETAMGKNTGDGLLGFSYALTKSGARGVLLSRWKVDDASTALLMLRFYENLLGKGLKKPLGRAAALSEAQKWLRELSREKAENFTAALKLNKLAGTRGKVVPLNLKPGEKIKLPAGDKPYCHPFYWAAFMLIGDPD